MYFLFFLFWVKKEKNSSGGLFLFCYRVVFFSADAIEVPQALLHLSGRTSLPHIITAFRMVLFISHPFGVIGRNCHFFIPSRLLDCTHSFLQGIMILRNVFRLHDNRFGFTPDTNPNNRLRLVARLLMGHCFVISCLLLLYSLDTEVIDM